MGTSLGLCFTCLECGLWWRLNTVNQYWKEKLQREKSKTEFSARPSANLQPQDSTGGSFLIPPELDRQPLEVPGAKEAYLWMGHLHVHDSHGMRRVEDFPAKKQGIFRIIAIGDSFTYGQGVGEKETWPFRLEQRLKPHGPVEILNLGVCGASSENIAKTLSHFLPLLQADLVIYGVCLNDFLPDLKWRPKALEWAFPLPEAVKHFFISRTLTGKFFDQIYNRILLGTGLRLDYAKQLRQSSELYKDRFVKDLKNIITINAQFIPRPPIAMVLNQWPVQDDPLSLYTQVLLSTAGFNTVPCEPYLKEYSRVKMNVGPWEMHPNRQAHEVFAQEFERYLLDKVRIK